MSEQPAKEIVYLFIGAIGMYVNDLAFTLESRLTDLGLVTTVKSGTGWDTTGRKSRGFVGGYDGLKVHVELTKHLVRIPHFQAPDAPYRESPIISPPVNRTARRYDQLLRVSAVGGHNSGRTALLQYAHRTLTSMPVRVEIKDVTYLRDDGLEQPMLDFGDHLDDILRRLGERVEVHIHLTTLATSQSLNDLLPQE